MTRNQFQALAARARQAPAATAAGLSVEPAAVGAAAAAVYALVVTAWRAAHGDGVLAADTIVAAVVAVYSLVVRSQVTPLARPRTSTGVPLRPDPHHHS